ncbi:MAG: ferritin-like domain-containing protein [Polyangiaceae bacterium]
MIRRELDRLRLVIRDLALLSVVLPAAVTACDETIAAVPYEAGVTDAGAQDATVTTPLADAAGDADADAAPSACDPTPYDAGPDVDVASLDFCANLVTLPCGLPADVVPRDGCYLTLNDCDRFCKSAFFNCRVWDDACIDGGVRDSGGPLTIDCATCLSGPGRKPRGLDESSVFVAAAASGGALFAAMARLEEAAIAAFRLLRRDLAALDAPRSLVRAAAAAARDESRHARVTTRLARRRGVVPPRARLEKRRPAPLSLAALALENAVEGCVHETFGALLAAHHAAHAKDDDVRRALARIAEDELRHAALAWAIARWAEPQLDDVTRARVDRARRDAARALAASPAIHLPSDPGVGLPSAAEQRSLARALFVALEAA